MSKEVFEENFKSYYTFGRSGIKYSEDQMKNLSQSEIQEMIDSGSVTFTEFLPASEILNQYKDKLTKEQKEQLEKWADKTLEDL